MPRRSVSLIRTWAAAAMPPPDLSVSAWADERRKLPQSSAAPGSRWQTAQVPYLRGFMDAVHEPGIHKIALMKCHQVAGSEGLHNIVGYFMEYDPCPILFVHPTVDVAEEWSKERLADMLRTTPALAATIREEESTLSLKMFLGGFLAVGGANTPNTFARRAVRLAIGDDVDRWPAIVGEEGDPADLLVNRTTTFYDALTIFVSTPTLKHGRIDTLYHRSDQRRYFVACPGCGHIDWITWNDPTHFRVSFDDRDADTARIECPAMEQGGCGAHMYEPDRRAMIALGAWQPTKTAEERGLAGFHLPAMLSTLGSVTLPALVDKWLASRGKGKESLRVFVNTSLAEAWEDRTARVEAHTLLSKREAYELVEPSEEHATCEVPAGAVALTCGVDAQADRFELQVIGWGLAGERWVVDWRPVYGNPKHAETRAMLLEALGRKYSHALGFDLPIHATCIDSGFATEEIYDFVLAYQVRRIYATKGFAGRTGEPIVGKPSEKRYGRTSSRPVRLYPINVDDAKSDVLNSITLPAGPGAMHFPPIVDEEYFAQLCAEHKETRYNKSGVATHTVWVQDRDRNEALDTAVLGLAAYRLLNPNIRQMAAALAEAARTLPSTRPAVVPATGPTTIPPTAVPSGPKPPERRVSRSKYLLS